MSRAILVCVTLLTVAASRAHPQDPASGPILIVETARGTISIETFQDEAPVSIAHIVALARRGFYDGQRVHRAIPGFVVQFGDPQSRDLAKRELWGRGAGAASGRPVGAAEITGRRKHTIGAVGLSHMGDPAKADSQLYITLTDQPDLDGRYAIVGRVIDGDDVPGLLQVGDAIVRMYVKE
jgi:cyclophilin family peptidyl-prolyl cis-trans isomerase